MFPFVLVTVNNQIQLFYSDTLFYIFEHGKYLAIHMKTRLMTHTTVSRCLKKVIITLLHNKKEGKTHTKHFFLQCTLLYIVVMHDLHISTDCFAA